MYSVEVPTLEAFNELVARVDRVEADNKFIKSLLLGERWLTRKQAMEALDCGHNKLRQLHLSNTLAFKYEGYRPYYDVFSIRAYLTAQKIDSITIDKRIIAVKYGT